MHEQLLEPLKYYDTYAKHKHKENAEAHFSALVGRSGVNIEENRETVKKYKAELEVIDNLAKEISKYKVFKVLLIIGIVIGAFLAIAAFAMFSEDAGTGMLLLLIGGGLIGGFVYLLIKKVNPKIKSTDLVKAEHEKIAESILQQAWAQMKPLNMLFRDDDAVRLIEKTIPEFSFDDKFTIRQEHLFVKEYDFLDLQNDDTSMVDTISGQFAGNPFLFARRKIHSLGTQTYHGSLTITWVETYRDSEGNLRTRHRSQTLHASVDKPKPFYNYNTFLIYGNQAAPDLNFSRENSHFERLSERALQRKIKRGENQLRKQAARSMRQGGNFQEMANSEFDVLFGANDRDNEVQFRLMYTPLAQRNTVDLIKDKNYYGDDFDFTKCGKFNLIMSEHAQNWQMNTSARNYWSYDIDTANLNFVNFNVRFFKSIFFDFAPLFSVPAYLDAPCASLDDIEDYYCNFTYYEHEVMANVAGYENFVHEDSRTDAILKTNLAYKDASADTVEVTAYSYTTCDRVDYVPVLGGDGHIHSVPVPWIEYIPVSRTSQVGIKRANADTSGGSFYHGMNIYSL